MSARGWRALAFVALAVVAVAAIGVARVARWPGRSAPPRPTPTASAETWQLALASFGDAGHGAIVMAGRPLDHADTFVTADGGRTWTPLHVGLSTATFLDGGHAVAVVRLPATRLRTSADAGRTWAERAVPVADAPFGFLLSRSVGGPVFSDPDDGWWLDNPIPPRTGPMALWHTADGGRSWGPLGAAGLPAGQRLGDPAFLDASIGALVAIPGEGWPSVLTTGDGGETWLAAPLPAAPVPGARITPAAGAPPRLLVEHGRLVLSMDVDQAAGRSSHWTSVSADRGRTWAPWSQEPGIGPLPLSAPTLDDAGRLLVADDRVLWTSADDGRTWQQRPLALPSGDHALAIVFAGGGTLLLAATPSLRVLTDFRLLRSTDDGAHWTEVRLPAREVS